MVDRVQGAAPQVCLWQVGPNRCALLPSAVIGDGWSTYRAATIPDAGTTALELYLYADAFQSQSPTTSEYAAVKIIEIPSLPNFEVGYVPSAANNAIAVSVIGRIGISNGDFNGGLWEPVGDCNAVAPVQAKAHLSAKVLPNAAPGGLPALELSASLDNACERQALDWHGGSLLISVMVKHLRGASPNICLWETGPEHCATLPSVRDTGDWSTYQASVSPDAGTTALTLHLYADAITPGNPTINEYADVRVIEVPALPSFALLGDPTPQPSSSVQLLVVHSSFSNEWKGPANSEHVLVDGMLNGWLVPTGSKAFSAYYEPTHAYRISELISLATYVLMLLLLIRPLVSRYVWRLGGWPSRRRSDETEKG